jgi:hypothetical protein
MNAENKTDKTTEEVAVQLREHFTKFKKILWKDDFYRTEKPVKEENN